MGGAGEADGDVAGDADGEADGVADGEGCGVTSSGGGGGGVTCMTKMRTSSTNGTLHHTRANACEPSHASVH